MEYIVDIQGFKRPFNEFVFKELAVIALEEDALPAIYLFLPLYNWAYLPDKYKSENRWLEYNYHGIPWRAGEISHDDVKRTIRYALRDATKVYVKGFEKKKWLEKIYPDVCNIEDLNCPSLQELDTDEPILCNHHKLCWRSNCVAQNAHGMKKWLLNKKKISAVLNA